MPFYKWLCGRVSTPGACWRCMSLTSWTRENDTWPTPSVPADGPFGCCYVQEAGSIPTPVFPPSSTATSCGSSRPHSCLCFRSCVFDDFCQAHFCAARITEIVHCPGFFFSFRLQLEHNIDQTAKWSLRRWAPLLVWRKRQHYTTAIGGRILHRCCSSLFTSQNLVALHLRTSALHLQQTVQLVLFSGEEAKYQLLDGWPALTTPVSKQQTTTKHSTS